MVHSTTKSSSANSFTVTRWSSKTTEHKLARARVNQRRHRERVKHSLATLESSLAQTQSELRAAHAKIERLTTELEAARSFDSANRIIPPTGNLLTDRSDTLNTPQETNNSAMRQTILPSAPQEPVLSRTSPMIGIDSLPEPRSKACILQDSPMLAHGLTFKPGATYDTILGYEDEEYRRLPPPSSEESTTLCRDAYDLIVAHNYAGLEIVTLQAWLRPGFRGAIRAGEACRVENTVLLTLLDYIS